MVFLDRSIDMNEKYVLLDNFDLKVAKDVCDILEAHNIDFRIEMNDSSIRQMIPFKAVLGGSYGQGVTAYIYVDADLLVRCCQLLEEEL